MAAASAGIPIERAERMSLGELQIYLRARSDMYPDSKDRPGVRDATQADIRRFAMG